MAMIGIVWLATMIGTSERSSSRTWTSRIARPIPSSDPRANPIAALRRVKSAAPSSRCRVVIPLASTSPNSIAMTQVWGSFTSVANANWNGGVQSIAMPVPKSESTFQGSPPSSLRNSQTTSSATKTVRKPMSGRSRRRHDPSRPPEGPPRPRPSAPGGHRHARDYPTAWSAISRAASMISKPSASWSSVMHSGGLVWIELLAQHRVQAVRRAGTSRSPSSRPRCR